MKGLETSTRNFRRRLTSALTNSSAKPKSWCLLRIQSNSVALCATRLCYFRTVDRSILAIWTRRLNDMHMGLTSCCLGWLAPAEHSTQLRLFGSWPAASPRGRESAILSSARASLELRYCGLGVTMRRYCLLTNSSSAPAGTESTAGTSVRAAGCTGRT
jgi:hypothetical protein